MKRTFLFFLLLLLGIASIVTAQPTLGVMSYNIRYDNPDDGENRWELRKIPLAELILRESPDLLGIQEGLHHQVQELEKLLHTYSWTGVGRDDGADEGEFAALFYNPVRLHLLADGTFWLSETPDVAGTKGWDAACVRIVTWAKFRDRLTKNIIFVFNTHWDHEGTKARKKSALLMKRKIREIAGNEQVIVMGDFNCNIRSCPMKVMMRKSGQLKLRDSRKLGGHRLSGPGYSFRGFSISGTPGDIIDHILVRGFSVMSYKILDDNNGRAYYSDHLPVVVVLSPASAREHQKTD